MRQVKKKQSKRNNRKQRYKKLSALKQINLNAAGIDIGAESHFVAVPEDRDPEGQFVREFGSFTADLNTLADWLTACGIETVAMESTGVYWIPLFEILENRGFEVHLVNPRHIKNVPGRKTDVVDCQWIQQLHTYGLLRGAFRPNEEICVLRIYIRQRDMLVSCASTHVLHMQKAMNQMNIKLHQVVSDITGVTGRKIIHAILNGQRDPNELAKLRDIRCKNDATTIALALQGNWRAEHLFSLQQAVELYEVYRKKLDDCDAKIEAHLQTFEDRTDGSSLKKNAKKKKRNKNDPVFNAQALLHKMSGLDLTRIEGINQLTALVIISEIGLDMSAWPTEKHFASWLALCPGSKISGGKILSSKTKPSANRVAKALRLAANSLYRSKSALGAFFRRKRAQLGAPKAITATAHKLARLIYNMLKYGTEYVDKGQDYYEQRYKDRVVKNLQRRAKELGYQITSLAAVQVET